MAISSRTAISLLSPQLVSYDITMRFIPAPFYRALAYSDEPLHLGAIPILLEMIGDYEENITDAIMLSVSCSRRVHVKPTTFCPDHWLFLIPAAWLNLDA